MSEEVACVEPSSNDASLMVLATKSAEATPPDALPLLPGGASTPGGALSPFGAQPSQAAGGLDHDERLGNELGLALLGGADPKEKGEEERLVQERKRRGAGPVTKLVNHIAARFKKIDNRLGYLRSLFIETNPALVRAFAAMEVTKLDQISMLEMWWGWCEDRPKMNINEFMEIYGMAGLPLGGETYARYTLTL